MDARLFLVHVLCLLVNSCAGVDEGGASTSGFLTLDVLRRDAYQLYPIRSPTQPRQRLFPHLTFTCTANITRWVFLAMWEEAVGGSYPEFQVWRESSNSTRYDKVEATTAEGAVCNGILCEHVPQQPLLVAPGDIFGLHQPHKRVNNIEVLYQDGGGGGLHYRSETEEPLQVFDLDSSNEMSTDHTLLAVLTEPPGCAAGFLSEAAVRTYRSMAQLRTHEEQQHIFPGITFTCNGTVTKWIVGAHKRDPLATYALEHPQFQIWKAGSSSGTYERSDIGDNTITSLQETAHPNLHDYVPSPPLEFGPGDVLGVYQPGGPESQVVLQYQWKAGQRSYTMSSESSVTTFTISGNTSVNFDLPYVGVEITGGEVEACTSGFLGNEDLRAKAERIVALRTHTGQQRLFPDITFNSEGRLGSWTFAAEYHKLENRLPEFQIWRGVTEDNYTLVESSASQSGQLLPTGHLNVYEYHMERAMSFQPGDFLGIFQPSEGSRLTLVFAEGIGPSSHSVSTTQALESVSNVTSLDNDYPLIVANILPQEQYPPQENMTTVTHPHTDPPTPSSSPPPTSPPATASGSAGTSEEPSVRPEKSSKDQLILAAVGASAGLLLGTLGTTIIVIGVVCACIGRKRKRRKPRANGDMRMEEGDGTSELEVNKARYSALPPQESSNSFSRGGPTDPPKEEEEEEEEHIYDRPGSVIRTVRIREALSPIPTPQSYDQPRVPSQMSNGTSLTPLSSPPSVTRGESLRVRENVAYRHTSDLDLSRGGQQTGDEEEEGGDTVYDDTSDYTGDSMEYVAAYGRPLNFLYDQPYGADGLRMDYDYPRM